MRKVTVWPPALGDMTERGNCCRIEEWRIPTTQSVSANWQSSPIAGVHNGSRWSRSNRRGRNRMKTRQRASDGIGNKARAFPVWMFSAVRAMRHSELLFSCWCRLYGVGSDDFLVHRDAGSGIGLFLLRTSQRRRRQLACRTATFSIRPIMRNRWRRWFFTLASMGCEASRTVLSARQRESFRWSRRNRRDRRVDGRV